MPTNLILECYHGNLEVVKEMIRNGENIEMAHHHGITPLSSASEQGHLEIVKVLIASGAAVNQATNEGYYTSIYCQSEWSLRDSEGLNSIRCSSESSY